MSNINIERVQLGPVSTNCYILSNTETGECVIIDPAFNAQKIINKCVWLKPLAILLTHGHYDHVSSAEEIKNEYGISVYASINEAGLLSDAGQNGSMLFTRDRHSFVADIFVRGGDLLDFCGIKIEVIDTPGHTSGSVCYYVKDKKILFSGDTLFYESIGRTDLPTGDMEKLKNSIIEILFKLAEDVRILPGHGDETTIGHEIKNNFINSL